MKFKSGDTYVEVYVEDFRTRVRLPAPPPFQSPAKSGNIQAPETSGAFLFFDSMSVSYRREKRASYAASNKRLAPSPCPVYLTPPATAHYHHPLPHLD